MYHKDAVASDIARWKAWQAERLAIEEAPEQPETMENWDEREWGLDPEEE